MPISRGATITATVDSATPIITSFSHTVNASTTLLVVTFHCEGDLGISSVNWNTSEAMTEITSVVTSSAGGDCRVYVFGRVNPTVTTANVSFTVTGAGDNLACVAVNYLGTVTDSVADATNVIDTENNGDAAAQTVALSGTTTSGSTLVAAGTFYGGDGNPSSDSSASFDTVSEGETGTSTTTDTCYYYGDKIGGGTGGTVSPTIDWTGTASDECVGVFIEIIPGDKTIAVPVGSGTFSGYAPDLTGPVSIAPGVGSGTFSGSAPTLNESIIPDAGSGQFLGYYPPTYLVDGSGGGPGLSLLFSLNIEGIGLAVPAGSGTFTGYALTWNETLPVGVGSGTFTGYAPALAETFLIGAGTGTFTGYALSWNETLPVGVGSGAFTGYALTWNETLPVGVGSGTFTGYIPTLSEQSAGVSIEVPAGSGTFAGSAPTLALTENQWITPDAGSGTFTGSAPTLALSENQWITIDAGSGTFTGSAPALLIGGDLIAEPGTGTGTFTGYALTIPSEAVVEERYAGGWYMARYEQEARRRRAKRKKLEEAIEAEISALIREEPAVPAETVVPEYVEEIRALIDEGIRQDQEFRRFIDGLRLQQSADELARLLAIDAAIRQYIRQRDEEEFIQLLMLAA